MRPSFNNRPPQNGHASDVQVFRGGTVRWSGTKSVSSSRTRSSVVERVVTLYSPSPQEGQATIVPAAKMRASDLLSVSSLVLFTAATGSSWLVMQDLGSG